MMKYPCQLYKNVINTIADPLTSSFNRSFILGCFPELLKIAKFCPIYENGSYGISKNYRPISLLPPFSKIKEKLMHIRLTSFLQKNNIINKSQHGFRSSHSISTTVIDLIDSSTSALDHNLMALALFIDISKAFDSLDHAILISKLEHYDVRDVALS